MCFCFVGLPFFPSASWPLSFLSLFFLFLQLCLIHARMPERGRAFVHGHTFLHSWSGPWSLVVPPQSRDWSPFPLRVQRIHSNSMQGLSQLSLPPSWPLRGTLQPSYHPILRGRSLSILSSRHLLFDTHNLVRYYGLPLQLEGNPSLRTASVASSEVWAWCII